MTDATRWPVREIPAGLRERYSSEGWWTDDTLGQVVDASLRSAPDALIRVWSDVRPWQSTYAGVRTDALRLVQSLTDAGVQPGEVVAFQLPNWREAVLAFYGLALGGFVLVPIVHIYGHKEVRFILAQSGARAYISPDRYGHVDYLDIVDGAAPDALPELDLHLVVPTSNAPVPDAPARIRRMLWDDIEQSAPATELGAPDPDDVCVLAYTSGTTSDPKGVMHTHRTLLAELAHIALWVPRGAPNLMGSPVTHATGMLGAVLAPMQLGEDIHLIDRWDPTRALQIMLEAGIGAGTGASVFLSSIIDHPDFTPEHAAMIRGVGLGGAPVPLALAERAASHGIVLVRAYGSTEHPSITGSRFDDPADKRHATDGPALPGVEIRMVDGEIWSRGPDL
ncbi:MAG: AMP-binding protein, partial [Acidimicrobiales bacterium]|nr:AMP-binding protein [Acidimicrobiales bacterium]